MKKIIIKNIAFLLIFILMLFSLVSCKPSITDNESDIISNTSSSVYKEPSKVTFYAVGDNLIHGAIFNQAKRRGGDKYDFAYAYKEIIDDTKAADVSIINQETIISDTIAPSHYPRFCTPPEMADQLVNMGFDVLNLATNHSLDKGAEGVSSSLKLLKTKPFLTTGLFENEADKNTVRVLEKNGMKISFVGVTYGTNGLKLPKGSELIINLLENEESIKAQIEAAKAASDFVVVIVHWGNEYTHKPSDYQREYAEKLADFGADVIIGHHPHVIQPIEYVTNKEGKKVLVAFSLGNFISAQDGAAKMLGAALNFTVIKDNNTGEITVENIYANPVVNHFEGNYSNIRVYPFSKYTVELAKKHGIIAMSPEFNYDYIKDTFNDVIGDFSNIK